MTILVFMEAKLLIENITYINSLINEFNRRSRLENTSIAR
jgi:hypothetical protein